jgi:hypothetical protein
VPRPPTRVAPGERAVPIARGGDALARAAAALETAAAERGGAKRPAT